MTYDGAWVILYEHSLITYIFRFLVWHRIEMQLTFLEFHYRRRPVFISFKLVVFRSDPRFVFLNPAKFSCCIQLLSYCQISGLVVLFTASECSFFGSYILIVVLVIGLRFLCVCWRPFVPIVVLKMLSFWLLWDCWVVLYFCGVRSSRLTLIFKRSGDGGLLLWIQV